MERAGGSWTPGQIFLYRGPRRFGLIPVTAPGQVLEVDDHTGVVHVSLYFEDARADTLRVDIAHLPIVDYALRGSIDSVLGEKPIEPTARERIGQWRAKRAADEAGAFSIPLWKARRNSWKTAISSELTLTLEAAFLGYAFPKRDGTGRFRLIEVEVVRRPPVRMT